MLYIKSLLNFIWLISMLTFKNGKLNYSKNINILLNKLIPNFFFLHKQIHNQNVQNTMQGQHGKNKRNNVCFKQTQ